MYLTEVHLRNLACFADLTLDLTRDGEPCRWVVLLGENGSGKSTLLQMIALALLGPEMIHEVAPGVEWGRLARTPDGYGRAEVEIVPSSESATGRDGGIAGLAGAVRLTYDLGERVRPAAKMRAMLQLLDNTLYDASLTGGWFACAYGPWRRLSRSRGGDLSSRALTASQRKSQRFATIFEEESALTLVSDWLADLEFRRLKEPENRRVRRELTLAVRSIEKVLPGVRFRTITSGREVIFEDDGVEVSLHQLSDGYRSTVAWVGDLVRRLVDAFPDAEDPLAASGVVLIDEIDLHLHPKWQRSIVEDVRKLFPNLQFIVTSHSPFVAQDMGESDKIVVLKKEDGAVTAREELDSVKGWRVDQILTSYLFDLESTRNASVAAVEREYEELLGHQRRHQLRGAMRGGDAPPDEQRLRELKSWLDQQKSSPGETATDNELFEAARSFIDLVDERLTR